MIEIDPRIAAGMRAQLAVRDRRVAEGDRQIGWKVGFGSPAAAAQLGLDRPLVGFLLESGVVRDGDAVPVGGWTTPMLEGEIAVHVARDVGPGASWDATRAAIGGLSSAIELADVAPPPTDVKAIVAGNIFHRHVALGPVDTSRSTAGGIGGRVLRDGDVVSETDDAARFTGEIVEVVRLTAELLEACGERLRAGEVVITGSIVAPLPVAAGQDVTIELDGLGALSLSLVD